MEMALGYGDHAPLAGTCQQLSLSGAIRGASQRRCSYATIGTACCLSNPATQKGGAMTFEEVLDQAIAMLQRRGRLTYRTLQLQFQLDEAHLEALKDELIYGQRLAIDEDGRVLVWTGDTG